MLDDFYTILTSNNPNLFFLRWVLVIAIITLFVFISKRLYNRNKQDKIVKKGSIFNIS